MNANPLQSAATAIRGLSKTLGNLQTANELLNRLERAVPSSRAQRAPNVIVSNIKITTQMLQDGTGVPLSATAMTGSAGYKTRITFQPKPGFNCTCPDLQQRRAACKHVAALAVECRKRFWAIADLIEGDVERFSIQLADLESSAERLSAESFRTLGDSLKALES